MSRIYLPDDAYQLHSNVSEVNWYKPDGSGKGDDDWQAGGNKAFAVEIIGHQEAGDKCEHWLLCFNAGNRDIKFNTPLKSPNGGWSLVLDTRYSHPAKQPGLRIQHLFLQAAHSFACSGIPTFPGSENGLCEIQELTAKHWYTHHICLKPAVSQLLSGIK